MQKKRKPFIVGNWKMNKGISETMSYINEFAAIASRTPSLKDREIGLAPAFTSLKAAEGALKGTQIRLCSQNVHWDNSGQFTGEISPLMLKELNVTHAIIGHSERRKFFGETNETVNKRVMGSVRNGLNVIMCVGETKHEREAGDMQKVVRDHVVNGLSGLAKDELIRYVTIAYEPVWAIGTGLNATVEQAVEVHKFIRTLIDEKFGQGVGDSIRILYGGSVKADNIDGFMSQDDIDGALVGGASLDVTSFLRIADFREVL
jgi:triosephosphate isomerase